MTFTRGYLVFRQFIIASVLSVLLMVIDYRYHWVNDARFFLEWSLKPVYRLVHFPFSVYEHMSFYFKSIDQLRIENNYFKQQSLVHARYLLQTAALKAENARLRALLYSAQQLESSSVIAEVLGVLPDLYRQELTLSKGSMDGIEVGQAVLDYDGIIGQIIHVGPTTSRVLLVSDANHVIPVQVNRNGARALVIGSGMMDRLYLLHVSHQADVKKGDLLISSGIDGRFPFGYPVASVTDVITNTNEHFSRIEAIPLSKLDRIRYVLIVMIKNEAPPKSNQQLVPGKEANP